MDDDMIQIVRSSTVFRQLRYRTGPVVLAVSGGIDSSSMLHLFKEFQCTNEVLFEPVVAHVQHDLREEGPEKDREFVQTMAEEYGMTFKCRKVQVRETVEQEAESAEAVARRKRYNALRKICQSVGANAVLTAHHRADQIQTILMRLWRGTGIQGLCGIRAVRPVEEPAVEQNRTSAADGTGLHDETGRVQVLRPMLDVPKEEIIEYVEERDLSWRADPSNSNLKHRRNLVRERLVPRVRQVLKTSYPDLLLRIRERATSIDQSLRDTWSGKQIGMHRLEHDVMIPRSAVQNCERMLYPYLLRRIKRSLSLPETVQYHDFLRLQELIENGTTGRQEVLSGGVVLRLEHRYVVARRSSEEGKGSTAGAVPLNRPGTAEWMWYSFITRPVGEGGLKPRYRSDSWKEVIDVSRAIGPFRITQRQPGDRIRPLGMSGHKKVKDIMIDQKIPASLRDRWPVIRDAKGIVWLPGLRLANRVRITDRSRSGQTFELSCDGGDELDATRCSD